mmetsp:Transcript_7477/g.22444  ORF Transcript_7477/g.22444 Transcript_7477/m.22444 type:complete len:511 (+) Transcript_7477:138-1670(+)
MVQIYEIHPDGTEEMLPAIADVTSTPAGERQNSSMGQAQSDGEASTGQNIRLRLLPSGSRELVCPSIDLEPVVPRSLLLQLQPSYPLARVPPNQASAILSALGWRDSRDKACMDIEDVDVHSTFSLATAGSSSTHSGLESSLEDSVSESSRDSSGQQDQDRPSGRRKLRIGLAPAASTTINQSTGTQASAAASPANGEAVEVDKLAHKFDRWSTDWEVSPPKRARVYLDVSAVRDGIAPSVTSTKQVQRASSGDLSLPSGGPAKPQVGDMATNSRPGTPPTQNAVASHTSSRTGSPALDAIAPPPTPTHSSCARALDVMHGLSDERILRQRSKRKAVDEAPIIDEMSQLDLGVEKATDAALLGTSTAASHAIREGLTMTTPSIGRSRKKLASSLSRGTLAGPWGGGMDHEVLPSTVGTGLTSIPSHSTNPTPTGDEPSQTVVARPAPLSSASLCHTTQIPTVACASPTVKTFASCTLQRPVGGGGDDAPESLPSHLSQWQKQDSRPSVRV